MILQHIYEESIAQSAYLLGCASTGEALVIDPHIDVQRYLDAAAAENLRIAGVTETHIHADFVSGARALARAAGARLYVSAEGGSDWQYSFGGEPGVTLLRDGDSIQIGRVRVDVVHTPGHTPEHLMYLVTDTAASEEPLGAFTGDFLFVGDVGRPDLLETAAGQAGTMEAGARQLFASLRKLAGLPDHLVIWPGHGSGSACGKSLGGVSVTSLGYERLANWALRETDEQRFVDRVLADQPDPPLYFGEMKRANKTGTPAWSAEPALAAVPATGLAQLVDAARLFVDVRGNASAGILPGAIVIPMGRSFSSWAGAVVPAGEDLWIVADTERAAATTRRVLAIIGRPQARGWIPVSVVAEYGGRGGMVESVEIVDRLPEAHTVVDVRSSAEWRSGHLEDAVHVPLARLPERIGQLDKSAPLLVYCQAGVRSIVAASALRRLGFPNVKSLAGGIAGYRERVGRAASING